MLTRKEAYKFLKNVHFPGEESATMQLASGSKQSRRALIAQKQPSLDRSVAAAIELQRIWRGYCTRCRLYNILNPGVSTKVIHTGSRYINSEEGLRDVRTTPSGSPHQAVTTVSSKESVQNKRPVVRTLTAKERLERYYEKYCHRKKTKGETNVITFEEFCAHFIQNWWHHVRRKHHQPQPQVHSVPQSCHSVGGTASEVSEVAVSVDLRPKVVLVAKKPQQVKKKKKKFPLDRREAARMIQRAWRRHIDVQVYRYYRDLINFRCRGDPSLMLRCVNPREAKLLDPASGIHVRFRLAGDKFPPNIYYKICTHNNIVDMCANSPKDYTAAATKWPAARDVHNNRTAGKGSSGEDERAGWYRRIENNGWRLVADRLLLRPEQDPVTWESNKKEVSFPHTRLQRRQDVEKKKKKRKLEWMKKMYHEGMLQSKSSDPATKTLVEGTAAGMVAAVESQGSEVISDWEVDEILEWTNGLNFDDYLTSWKELATTSGSEKFCEEHFKFKTTSKDPYEFSMTVKKQPMTPTPSQITYIRPLKASSAVSIQ